MSVGRSAGGGGRPGTPGRRIAACGRGLDDPRCGGPSFTRPTSRLTGHQAAGVCGRTGPRLEVGRQGEQTGPFGRGVAGEAESVNGHWGELAGPQPAHPESAFGLHRKAFHPRPTGTGHTSDRFFSRSQVPTGSRTSPHPLAVAADDLGRERVERLQWVRLWLQRGRHPHRLLSFFPRPFRGRHSGDDRVRERLAWLHQPVQRATPGSADAPQQIEERGH